MASRIRIDFDNVYELNEISPDFKLSSFKTILAGGTELPFLVKISNHPHELIPDFYNMVFGPLNKQVKIDDKVALAHADYSRGFSTQDLMYNYFIFTLKDNNPAGFKIKK